MIIGAGRIVAQGSRDELLADAGTLVRAPTTPALAARARAPPASPRARPPTAASSSTRSPRPSAAPRSPAASRSPSSGPAEGAGLEQLFFDLTGGAPDRLPAGSDLLEMAR